MEAGLTASGIYGGKGNGVRNILDDMWKSKHGLSWEKVTMVSE